MALKVIIALPGSSSRRQIRAKAKTTLVIACKFKHWVSAPPAKIQTQRSLCASTPFFTPETDRAAVPRPGKTQVRHSVPGLRRPAPHPSLPFPRPHAFHSATYSHSLPSFFYHFFPPNLLFSSLLFPSLRARG